MWGENARANWEKRLQIGLRGDWSGAREGTGATSGRFHWQPRIGFEIAAPGDAPAATAAGAPLAALARGTWKLSAGCARALRLPTLNDLYWGGDLNVQGNPDLRPERSTTFDAAIEGSPSPASSWRTALRAWRSSVTDWIEWRAGPALQWRPVNLPRVRFSGWEWSFDWRPGSAFEAGVGCSRQRAENRDSGDLNGFGRQLPYRAEYSARTRARWQSKRGDRLEATLRWRGKEPATVANTVWVPAHLVVDLGSRWVALRRSAWQLDLGLWVTNLLDRYDPSVIDQLPPGREIRFSLELSGRTTGRGAHSLRDTPTAALLPTTAPTSNTGNP